MAEMLLSTGLQAMDLGATHYDKVKDPVTRQYRKMRGREPREDPDLKDDRNHDEKGYSLRRRSQVQSDEEIVEVVRHRGEVLPRKPRKQRPGMARNTSSMDDLRESDYRSRNRGGYDSESSVPPRGRVRPRSESGRSRKKKGSSSSSSSSSSSDPGSSTDDEKKCKSMQRKKWITAALASVATIHAAQKVYTSIEAHDKRVVQVERGEISPREAQQQKRAARWQDAAAIGIAALGIKGAMSEWSEVTEEHKEHKELMRKREEHHQKRLELARRNKARETTGYYKGRDGQWYYDGPQMQDSERSRSQRGSAWVNSQYELDGLKHNDRKLIGNGGRDDRSRDSRSRARSTYDRDRDDRGYGPQYHFRDYERDRSRHRRPSRRDDDDF